MRWKVALFIGYIVSAMCLQAAVGADSLPPRTEWLPQDAVIAIEVSQPKALLDLALSDKVKTLVTSSPQWKHHASQAGLQQVQQVIHYVEATLGTDWQTGLRKLVGGGMTSATSSNGASVLIVDAEDEKLLQRFNDFVVAAAKGEAAKRGQSDAIASKEHRGVTVWMAGGESVYTILGARLILANRLSALDAVLDRRVATAPGSKSLANRPAFQEAKKSAGEGAAAFLYVDLEAIKRLPQVQQALARGEEPAAALLFGGVQDALRGANWLAVGLSAERGSVSLTTSIGGKPTDASGLAAFARPAPGKGALPNLSVPGRIAAVSLYRDLHGLYAAKDKLSPERTSGLIFFENMMGIFFSGRDFTEEVLGQLQPEVRIVVAQQRYDQAVGIPSIQIPAVAAIFRMKDPKKFSEIAEEAWQKAIGLVSFTSGQKAQPGFIIDRPTHGDTRYTVAFYSARAEKDRKNLDTRFNFRPSLAQWGDFLILSSADGLTRDLIDALKAQAAQAAKALPQTHTLVEIDFTQIASALAVNRGFLIRQNMVDKGASREQAETDIGAIITAVKTVSQLILEIGSVDGQPRATLKIDHNLQ